MIGYLRGTILENSAGGKAILLVHSAGSGAVGYALTVPTSPAYLGWVNGKQVEAFVHTHVREDQLDLYGFSTRAEKDIFLTLLGVSGIGPKGAMGILSGAEPAELMQAIVDGDKEFLTALPGIGKKTAERVILELADPLRKKMEEGALLTTPAPGPRISRAGTAGDPANAGMVRDARSALVGLGYREQDVTPLLQRVLAEAENRPRKVEDLIRCALQELG